MKSVNVGDCVRMSKRGQFQFWVRYTGGVGQNGIGEGVFNWDVEAQRAGRPEGNVLMGGNDPDTALRCAELLTQDGKLGQ